MWITQCYLQIHHICLHTDDSIAMYSRYEVLDVESEGVSDAE